jgi:hypothetical protein
MLTIKAISLNNKSLNNLKHDIYLIFQYYTNMVIFLTIFRVQIIQSYFLPTAVSSLPSNHQSTPYQ